MGTRIDQFRESMESTTGEDLRMFMFTREQLEILQHAMQIYKHRAALSTRMHEQCDRWIEAFDPDWKE